MTVVPTTTATGPTLVPTPTAVPVATTPVPTAAPVAAAATAAGHGFTDDQIRPHAEEASSLPGREHLGQENWNHGIRKLLVLEAGFTENQIENLVDSQWIKERPTSGATPDRVSRFEYEAKALNLLNNARVQMATLPTFSRTQIENRANGIAVDYNRLNPDARTEVVNFAHAENSLIAEHLGFTRPDIEALAELAWIKKGSPVNQTRAGEFIDQQKAMIFALPAALIKTPPAAPAPAPVVAAAAPAAVITPTPPAPAPVLTPPPAAAATTTTTTTPPTPAPAPSRWKTWGKRGAAAAALLVGLNLVSHFRSNDVPKDGTKVTNKVDPNDWSNLPAETTQPIPRQVLLAPSIATRFDEASEGAIKADPIGAIKGGKMVAAVGLGRGNVKLVALSADFLNTMDAGVDDGSPNDIHIKARNDFYQRISGEREGTYVSGTHKGKILVVTEAVLKDPGGEAFLRNALAQAATSKTDVMVLWPKGKDGKGNMLVSKYDLPPNVELGELDLSQQ